MQALGAAARSRATLLLWLLIAALLVVPTVPPARANTPACGDIVGSVTWTSTTVVTCNVVVPPGASLTIQPGVTVRMYPGVSIYVEGTLTAVGTSANLIVVVPDNIGNGNWETIQFNATGVGRVAFADVSHGNRTLAAEGASPSVDNNTLRSAGAAVFLRRSSAMVANNSIVDSTYGVYAESSTAQVVFNTVDRARFAIFANGGFSTVIMDNTVTNTSGPAGRDAILPGAGGGSGGSAFGILAFGVADVQIRGNTVTSVRGGNGGNGAANPGGPGGGGGAGGDAYGIAVGNAQAVSVAFDAIAQVVGGRGGNGGGGSATAIGGPGGNGGGAYAVELLNITGSSLANANSISTTIGGFGGDGGIGSPGNRNGAGGAGRDAIGIFGLVAWNAVLTNNSVSTIRGGGGGNSTIGGPGGSPAAGGNAGAAAGIFGLGVPGFHDYEFNVLASLLGGSGGRGRAGGSGGDGTAIAVLGDPSFVNSTFLIQNFIDTVTGGAGGLGTLGGGPGGSATGEAIVNVRLTMAADAATLLTGGNGGAATGTGGAAGSASAFFGLNIPSGTAASFSASGVTPGVVGSGGTPAQGAARGIYTVGSSSLRTAIKFVNATIASVAAGGFDFAVDTYAEITALNASWNPAQLSVAPAGNLTIQNFLDIRALWPNAATPVAGARFTVRDNGVEVHNTTAGASGWARWLVVTDRRYIGSMTATENITTVAASYPPETFAGSPRNVGMATSHAETFVMVDATAPASSLGALPTYTATVVVSVPFASSDGAGVGVQNVTLYYSRNGGLWVRYTTVSSPSGTFPFDSSATGGDGTYAFTTVAADVSGNAEPGPGANKSWTIVDTSRPGSHVAPLPLYETSLSFLVTWAPDAGVVDVVRYVVQVRDNGGLWVNWLEGTTLTSSTFTGQDGHTYEFRSIASDAAGNIEPVPGGNDTWTVVDVTRPRSSVAALPTYETATSFTLTWSQSAGTTDVAAYTIEVSRDGQSWTTVVNGTTGTSMTFSAQDGHRYAFRAIARDRAGNWEAKSSGTNDTWTIVDATPPTIVALLPSGTGVSASAPIVITFSEPMGTAATEAAISFTPSVSGAYSWNANGTVLTFVSYDPLAAGTQYTVVVGSGARDRAGNPVSQRVFQFATGVAAPGGPAIADLWWVILVIAAAVVAGVFLALRMRKPAATGATGGGPAAATKPEESTIEDVFLLYRDGILIKHQTRRLKPDIDSDILSGMLTAVQAFVKDSFRGEAEGDLDEMKFGEMRIMIGRGKYMVLAAMVTGGDTVSMKTQIQACILEVEEKHWDQLDEWKGDMAIAKDLDPYVKKLIRGEYR